MGRGSEQKIKGLILAGGTGSRLHPITEQIPKQLLPVANKPILYYGIEHLVSAGISEIGIIVSPESLGPIRKAVGDGYQLGARVTYIVQSAPLGLAHALLTAEDFIGNSPFVVYLGDNLLRDGIEQLVRRFTTEQPEALLLATPVPDPRAFGVTEVEGDRVLQLVEKPEHPRSDLALVGVYLLRPSIFNIARSLQPSARGELEITEAIQGLIDQGLNVGAERVQGWWKDTGQVDDLLEANSLILSTQERRIEGYVDRSSRIEGAVIIKPGASVVASLIEGPVIIDSGAWITGSYIGPNSSIGAASWISNSDIHNAILGPETALIAEDDRVSNTLIYREQRLTGARS